MGKKKTDADNISLKDVENYLAVGSGDPDDFYYKITDGRKSYYLKQGDTYIRTTAPFKQRYGDEFFTKVQEQDLLITKAKEKNRLLTDKQKLKAILKVTQKKITDIESKLVAFKDVKHVEILEKYNSENANRNVVAKEISKIAPELIKEFQKQDQLASVGRVVVHKEDLSKYRELLKANGISCKTTLGQWLSLHHPNINKDSKTSFEYCQEILAAAKKVNYI